MSDWSHDGLWTKPVDYARRATDEDRDGPLYPLWSTLALEFIARSCLAKVHPALLADATDENVLHACGYPSSKGVRRSISAHSVMRRCRLIVKGFTDDDHRIAMHLIERRNAEFHSGTPGFAGYGTELWLSDYFRICRLLLSAQNKSLTDLLGAEEASVAEKMIAASEEKVAGAVKKAIAEAKQRFGLLDESARESINKAAMVQSKGGRGKVFRCPACDHLALVRGEAVSIKKAHVDDESGRLYRRTVILPTSLECLWCQLSLKGHAALHAAGAGGNHELLEEIDPAEYFGLEQPSDEDMQAYAEEWLRDRAEESDAEFEDEE
jgi:hypothetical protein